MAKNCWQRKCYAEAGWKGGIWQLPHEDSAFSMAGSSIVTNPTAPGVHYARARALRILLLLQASPLKCSPSPDATPCARPAKTACPEVTYTPLRLVWQARPSLKQTPGARTGRTSLSFITPPAFVLGTVYIASQTTLKR